LAQWQPDCKAFQSPALHIAKPLGAKQKKTQVTHNEIIKSYLECPYKAKKIINNKEYVFSEYEQFMHNQGAWIKNQLLDKYEFQSKSSLLDINTFNIGFYCINKQIEWNDFNIAFDLFKIDKSKDDISFAPIFYSYTYSLTSREKLYYSLLCLAYEEILSNDVNWFYFFNSELKLQKVALENNKRNVRKDLNSYLDFLYKNQSDTNQFYKNNCKICSYEGECYEEQKAKNCISLLGGTNETIVKRFNNKGIFTIEQLSYTFRPRKNVKRYYHELRALSIRENRIYVWDLPDSIESSNRIFLDIEYLPAENFIYLVGVLAIRNDEQFYKYYWADTKSEFENMLSELHNFLSTDNSVIYHYGNAENKLFKELEKRNYPTLKNKCVNLLSQISGNIYYPTLKNLAQNLGFNWSTNISDGLSAIINRKCWEVNKSSEVKSNLIIYNKEDCIALRILYDSIVNVTKNKEDYISIPSLRRESVYNWRNTDDYFENTLNEINKLSYFTYNQDKIYIRTDKVSKKSFRLRQKTKHKRIVPNEIREVYPKKCPNCKTVAKKNLRNRVKHTRRTVIDLKYMQNGIKRWIVQYNGGVVKCKKCSKRFSPQNVFHIKMFGDNLKNYCVNQHVAHNVSFSSIADSLIDFNININKIRVFEFKQDVALKCTKTYELIRKELISGNLIQIDETEVKLDKKRKGYVWVFSNFNTVYYLFRPDRKADFLKDFLCNFKGVVLSDFYKGYDSLPQKQQKCIVHLLRDLNTDFFHNQFDDELKKIVIDFGKLLKSIVLTIDEKGLKRHFLKRYKKEVDDFYNLTLNENVSSDLALKYILRFKKYKEKLFTFLEYDNIPWHNNNAEYAIKSFAKHREKGNRIFTENSINSYMILSSIEQTCKYRGNRFMEYLKNKEILNQDLLSEINSL
jgi:predicted RecB family nuclease